MVCSNIKCTRLNNVAERSNVVNGLVFWATLFASYPHLWAFRNCRFCPYFNILSFSLRFHFGGGSSLDASVLWMTAPGTKTWSSFPAVSTSSALARGPLEMNSVSEVSKSISKRFSLSISIFQAFQRPYHFQFHDQCRHIDFFCYFSYCFNP